MDRNLFPELARRLDQSERTRQQIRHFSLDFPDITIEDAYEIQRQWVAMKLAAGRRVVGHKIGLTSKAMQYASNISEPDYGTLLDDMVFEPDSTIPIARFIVPRVEVELAFILREPLRGPGCTLDAVLAATDWVVPAVEIIDARIQQVDPETRVTRKVMDTISDNAANAGIVLSRHRFKPDQLDLRWVSALCIRNGEIEVSGVAAAVLNHPGNGVAWLVNKLAPWGVGLAAGEIVLGGSFVSPVAARSGDHFLVDFGPHGSIDFTFG